MEEYMESELCGIFRVKLVTKNIVRGSPGTQFMHMRVKTVKLFERVHSNPGLLVKVITKVIIFLTVIWLQLCTLSTGAAWLTRC